MDLDALLARSQAPGHFVERRSFTLSRGKALSKMRDFTLRNEHQFGLELVQAGVFAGANWVFADCDPHQATIGWVGGRSLRRAELDGLLDYLFIGEGASADRHLRQLAVAVNVLLRRKPLVLRVESGDDEGAVRLDLEADGTGVVGVPAEAIFGTYLHVRFSKPWFFETRGHSDVAAMIESECGYSPVPIFVNGDGPLGWDRHLPLSNPMSSREAVFRADGRDGWIGRHPRSHGQARVKVVVGGVVVSRREVPEFGPRTMGVIRDDQLAKTADMSDVVADHNWNRMLHHVQPLVDEHVWDGLEPLPELEPLIEPVDDDEHDDAPVPVAPLTSGLTLLGTSVRLPVDRLSSLAHEPLFWVDAAEVRAVEERLGDQGFPGRVVVLTEGQRQGFADLIQGLRANRLQPDDILFVRDQLTKGQRAIAKVVATRLGLLTLTWHAAGPLPGWRVHPVGVATLLRHPDRTEEVVTLPLHLPRVSAVLELDTGIGAEELRREVVRVVERHVWSLAVEARDPALTRSLLGQALFLHPTETGICWELPAAWPEAASALLALPLVADGPHANALLEALQTSSALVVEREADVLASFADRFGGGHVSDPARPPHPLVALQWDGTTWNQVDHPVAQIARGVILLMDQYVGQTASSDPSPHPAIVYGRRSSDEAVPFSEGLDLLRQVLRGAVETSLPAPADDVLQSVRIALLGDEVILETPSGPVTAGAIARGDVSVALRGGPDASATSAVVLPWDLTTAIGGAPRWHLDDPPELWAPEPDPDEWLVTVPVLDDVLAGWIGLRFPYDPTGGLLLHQGLASRIVGELEHGVRFHGRLDQTETGDALPAIRAHTLQVLRALRDVRELSPEREAARQRYCADFAAIARLHPACAIPESLADELARQVHVGEWGTLYAWLAAPPEHRPALPLQVLGLTAEPLDPDATLLNESSGSLLLDAMRLTLRSAGLSTRVGLSINPDGWHTVVWDAGAPTVTFGGRSRVVRRADRGETRPLALTLLDAVRRLVAFEEEKGTSNLDLLALHRSALEVTVRLRP